MNPVEQQQHRTVTRNLQQQLTDLIMVVAMFEEQQAKLWGETVAAITEERLKRHTMRDGLRTHVEERLQAHQRTFEVCIDWHIKMDQRTCWQRLRWLVTGR